MYQKYQTLRYVLELAGYKCEPINLSFDIFYKLKPKQMSGLMNKYRHALREYGGNDPKGLEKLAVENIDSSSLLPIIRDMNPYDDERENIHWCKLMIELVIRSCFATTEYPDGLWTPEELKRKLED